MASGFERGQPQAWSPAPAGGAEATAGESGREGRSLGWLRWTLLAGSLAILYFPTLNHVPFYTKGEPREAVTAQLLGSQGWANWILPRRPAGHGLEVASKPPLFHWLVFLASRPQGKVTELSARLPSAVLAGAAVMATAMVGSAVMGARPALYGALILTTNIEWLRAATTARVDMTVTAFVALALLLLYRSWTAGLLGGARLFLACALMGAGVLAKGPIGIVLPAGVLATAMIVGERPRRAPASQLLAGFGLAVVIGAAWYLAASLVGGEEFVQKQILKENVFRFLSRADTLGAGHKHPFYYFVPSLAGGLAPWSLCLVPLTWDLMRGKLRWREPRISFLLCWFAFVFLFYSASASKRSVYLLPLYPALALLIGKWWSSLPAAGGEAPARLASLLRLVGGFLSCLFLLPLVVLVCERLGFRVSELIKPFLHHRDQANLPLVRDLILANFPIAMGWGLLCSLSAVGLGRAFAAQRWHRAFSLTFIATAATLAMVVHVFQPPLAAQRTLKPFIAMVKRSAATRDLAVCRFESTFDYSIEFYFGAPVPLCLGLAGGGPRSRGDRRRGASAPVLALLWDEEMEALSPAERRRLEVLATSIGTDPSGKKHLKLARWVPGDT